MTPQVSLVLAVVVIVAAVFATNFQPVFVALLIAILVSIPLKRLLPAPPPVQQALVLLVMTGIVLVGAVFDPQPFAVWFVVGSLALLWLSVVGRWRKRST